MSMDVHSLLIMDWKITKGNIHDSKASNEMIDSVRDYSYILADSAYDTSEIYDYIFENIYAIPIIDTNKRRESISNKLRVNRKIGIGLWREYFSLY